MKENCILWVKWKKAWPKSRQGTWESAGSGNNDPNGWLLSERLKDIEHLILEWKIECYPTLRDALDATFANPVSWDEVRRSERERKR